MTSSTEPPTEPILRTGTLDTGPQAVLELAQQGLTQRDIAAELHISQPTVTRRLKEATEIRRARRRAVLVSATLLTAMLCLIVMTAALATMAWLH